MSRKTQKFVVYLMIGIMLVTTILTGVAAWF
ncbi:stressosome-associated protein Prli42 [uncultured Metabacillus sp.]|nr:stressosome-associated protein Prli42 [uncultured Metabacillus sp.]